MKKNTSRCRNKESWSPQVVYRHKRFFLFNLSYPHCSSSPSSYANLFRDTCNVPLSSVLFTPSPSDPPRSWGTRTTSCLSHGVLCPGTVFANRARQLMATQSQTHCSLISSPHPQLYQSFPILQLILGPLHSSLLNYSPFQTVFSRLFSISISKCH